MIFSVFSLPVRGLVPALVHTLRPTETIPAGTIRTTGEVSGVTTEVTGGRTITEEEIEATTSEVITRTEEEEEVVAAAMATKPTGKVVVGAGMIGTMTRNTTRTAPGGGAPAPVRPRSARGVAVAPASRTAHPQAVLGAPSAQAARLGPRPHVTAAARTGLAVRKRKKSWQKLKPRNQDSQQVEVPSRRCLEANGSTLTPALKQAALRKMMVPLPLRAKALGPAVLCGKPSAPCPLRSRAPPCRNKPPRSVALGSSQRKKLEIKP